MNRLAHRLPTLGALALVAALVVAAAWTYSGESDSNDAGATADRGGLLNDPAGPGASIKPKKA